MPKLTVESNNVSNDLLEAAHKERRVIGENLYHPATRLTDSNRKCIIAFFDIKNTNDRAPNELAFVKSQLESNPILKETVRKMKADMELKLGFEERQAIATSLLAFELKLNKVEEPIPPSPNPIPIQAPLPDNSEEMLAIQRANAKYNTILRRENQQRLAIADKLDKPSVFKRDHGLEPPQIQCIRDFYDIEIENRPKEELEFVQNQLANNGVLKEALQKLTWNEELLQTDWATIATSLRTFTPTLRTIVTPSSSPPSTVRADSPATEPHPLSAPISPTALDRQKQMKAEVTDGRKSSTPTEAEIDAEMKLATRSPWKPY